MWQILTTGEQWVKFKEINRRFIINSNHYCIFWGNSDLDGTKITDLDSVEFFTFILLLSELLSSIVVFISVILSLHSLSSLSSLPLLGVLCDIHSQLGLLPFYNSTQTVWKWVTRGWYTPIIFLPMSWNILLFFLSSSNILLLSSVCSSLRFRASASRSSFERNLGWKGENVKRSEEQIIVGLKCLRKCEPQESSHLCLCFLFCLLLGKKLLQRQRLDLNKSNIGQTHK